MFTMTGALAFGLVFYIYVFPMGYFLLHLKKIQQFNKIPFLIRIPAYLTFGLIAISLIFSIIGHVKVNATVFLYVFLFSCLLNVFLLFKNHHFNRKKDFRLFFRQIIPNLAFFVLFVVFIVFFCMTANRIKWPMIGDSVTHGMLVSLILHLQKIPSTYAPLAPSIPVVYPQGFHSVSAFFSAMTGYYPGESILLTAAFTTALIPSLLYFVTYTKTKSTVFSLLPSLAVFLIHPARVAEWWVMGYFIHGSYPSLMGLLFIIAFFSLICFGNPFKNTDLDLTHFLILVLIIGSAIIFVYRLYFLFFVLYLIFYLILNRNEVFLRLRRIKATTQQIMDSYYSYHMVSALIISCIILLFIKRDTLFRYFSALLPFFNKPPLDFYQEPSALFSTVNSIIIPLSFFIVITSLLRKEDREVPTNLFYLCIFVPLALSLKWEWYASYLSYFLPERSFILLELLSWVIFSRFLHSVSKWILANDISKRKILIFQKSTAIYSLIIIYLFFFSSLLPSLNILFSASSLDNYSASTLDNYKGQSDEFAIPYDVEQYRWLLNEEYGNYSDDYIAAMWITKNIPSEDLILNDLSWASLYLLSFSIKNYVVSYWSDIGRVNDCKQLWDHPEDKGLIKSLIKKYGIMYILVSSEGGYFDWWGFGGSDKYLWKAKKPSEYNQIFHEYPFLTLVFESAQSKVYRVNVDALEK